MASVNQVKIGRGSNFFLIFSNIFSSIIYIIFQIFSLHKYFLFREVHGVANVDYDVIVNSHVCGKGSTVVFNAVEL